MTSHPSDLALERLLKGEPSPPGASAHLEACDACWNRWEHLHADEGWAPPDRPALPAPANNNAWAPWAIAATSAGIALAASALLLFRPVSTAAEVDQLREQVQSLRLEIGQVQQGAAETAPPVSRRPQPAAETHGPSSSPHLNGPTASSATSATGSVAPHISPEVLDAAVARGLEERARNEFDQKREMVALKTNERIAAAADELVTSGLLSSQEAAEVEALLLHEFEETWALKESTTGGYLSKDDAVSDWKSLRAETDEALREYLSEEELARLRGAIQGK